MKTSPPEPTERYCIPNLANACRVLRLLSGNKTGLSLTAIREALGIPHTSALRILRTLQSEDFVRADDRNFALGPAFLEMGAQHFSGFNLRKAALPALRQLVERTGETAHLCVPSGYQSLILEVLESPKPVRVASRPGTLADLHCSATGKVFLAYLFAHEVETIAAKNPFNSRTERTLTSVEELAENVEHCAREVRWFGMEPKVALLSHSNFGSHDSASARRMRAAVELLNQRLPELEVEGEMHADQALSEGIRNGRFPGSRLQGKANLLVMPNQDAANIAFNMLKLLADGISIGPILVGTARPVHIATPSVSVRGLLNLTALAAVRAGCPECWTNDAQKDAPT